jgi:DNA-binding response OmpR family regulator
MRALLRRHAGRIEPQLSTAELALDPATRTVTRAGVRIQLTAREFSLLHALMQRPGTLLSRAQLEERIYGWANPVESNAVEFLLHSLRRKIGNEQIENLRGLGWRIAADK